MSHRILSAGALVVPCSTMSTEGYKPAPKTERRGSLHRLSFRTDISVPDDLSFDGHKDLPSLLKEIETECAQTLQFLTKIECMAACPRGVLFGLESGEVALLSISPSGVSVAETSEFAHEGKEVSCLAVSPDGRLAASGSFDKTVKMWAVADMRELAELTGHTSRVQCIAFSPNGDYLASGSRKGEIYLWDTRTFEEVLQFEGHDERVTRLLFTPDSAHLLSSSWDSTLKVWALAQEEELATLEGHSDYINCLALTPNGRFMVSGSEDDSVKVWRLADMAEVANFVGHGDRITAVVITSDGVVALSSSEDATIKMWNLLTLTEIGTLEGHTSDVTCVALTPNDQYCISGSLTGEVKVWSIATRSEVANLISHSAAVTAVTVSMTGRHLVLGTIDGIMKVWTLADSHAEVVYRGHTEAINCLAVSPDSQRFVSGSKDSTLRVWEADSMREVAILRGHTDYVNCVAFTPDSKYIVSGSVDTTVRVWSYAFLTLAATLTGHRDKVYCLAVTPCGKKVVTGAWDSTVKIWSLEDMCEVGTLVGHTYIVFSLAVASNGEFIVSGTSTGELKIWSIGELRETASLIGHTDEITSISITSDSRLILSASWDRSVRLWSSQNYCLIATFLGHAAIVKCLAVTPDGKYAISGSVDQSLKVWSLAERQEVATLYGHTSEINCVAVCLDGVHLLSGSTDTTVRLWSLVEMREMTSFIGHTDRVHCLAVTLNGERVISGAFDASIRSADLTAFTQQIASVPATVDATKVSAMFAANLPKLRKGIITQRETFSFRLLPANFNSLHISAYYNNPLACEHYFSEKAPALRGAYGSPLTVALKRNTTKCIDVILAHLRSVCRKESSWFEFRPYAEDLPLLLSCNSPLVVRLLQELLAPPVQPHLPQFIVPLKRLPLTQYATSRFIDVRTFAKFEENKLVEADSILVEFLISLFRWNFAPGSTSSLGLLRALGKCRNRKVLTTDFVSTLVETKWKDFFPLTLALTTLYALLIVDLVSIVFRYLDDDILAGFFLTFNVIFLLYEVLQIIGNRGTYWLSLSNVFSLVRAVLCIVFSAEMLHGGDTQSQRIAILILCFVRGFTYFRTFTMTRVFVYMTIEVVKEVYSFLLILAYSVMCFGIIASELSHDDGFSVSWTVAFNLLVGNFDTTDFGLMQWIVFICANVLNVVVMLNLLVSILSDAYDKAQMSLKENDVHQMLGLVIEYESVMFWNRTAGAGSILVRCNQEVDRLDDDEWDGRINKIAKSVHSENKKLVEKVATNLRDNFTKLTQAMGTVQLKMDKVGSELPVLQADVNFQLLEIKKHMAVMDAKLERTLALVSGRG